MSGEVFTLGDLSALLDIALTEEQQRAVAEPMHPFVVIAGAGSGKTTVMSARVVWLVANGWVRPDEILGLTFTNKAASQLSARIRRALHRLSERGVVDGEGEPAVATYHAYAGSLVREYGLREGLEPSARLLTEASRFQLADRVVRRAPGPFDAIKYRLRKLTEAVASLDAELNEHLVEPTSVAGFDDLLITHITEVERDKGKLTKEPATARDSARARAELLELVAAFRAEKRRVEAVDFGDVMAGAASLARRSEVATSERNKYRTVLLDEYQDTSVAQKELLLGLFGNGYPVTAVGDPFQAIYGWRGASVRNIVTFPTEFGTQGKTAPVLPLAQNNRSDEAILGAANAIAEPLRKSFPMVAPLTPRADRSGRGEVVAGLFRTREEELNAISDDIVRRIQAGANPGEIAVLCRDSRPFAPLHRALTSRDVPVEVVGLGGLLSLPEVVDVVAVLSVLDDPAANPDMVRTLTSSRWRIGPRDLALLGSRAHEQVRRAARPKESRLQDTLQEAVTGIDPAEVVSLSEAIHDPGAAPYSAEARARFRELDDELTALRAHLTEPLPDLVRRVIETMGLDVEVAASRSDRETHRPSILAQFLAEVGGFADLEGSSSLTAFLSYLDAAAEFERGLDVTSASTDNSVKVMTAHKAKGLEWPIVYVPSVCERVFPSGKGRPLWTSNAGVLPFELRGDAADFASVSNWVGNKGVEKFRGEMKALDEAEERRLAYVAMTRAEETLVVTGHWWGPTQQQVRGPSPYLLAVHEFCDTGHGQVWCWEPAPTETRNPALAALNSTPWPVALSPRQTAARHAGAQQVRDAMVTISRGEQISLPIDVPPRIKEWDDDLAALLLEAQQRHTVSDSIRLPTTLTTSRAIQLVQAREQFVRQLVRPMPRPPVAAARRGTAFHAWVESLFGQRSLIDLDDLTGEDEEVEPNLQTLQKAFLAGPFAERPPVAVEAPFQLVLANRVISGRIDAVYEADDHIPEARFEIVDWKTGVAKADPLQLAIYRLAWAELVGVPVDEVAAAFYYVARNSVEYQRDLPGRPALEGLVQRATA